MTTITRGRIVVAADGSKHANRAVSWAAEQAALERRTLVVLTAGDVSAHRTNASAVALARQVAPTLEATGLVVADDPRTALVDVARDAHLLVLGSRGRGTVRTMVLGSVSAAVSRLAPCPVVVCRPRHDDLPGKGVLVGVDGTEDSRPVLEVAFAQASLRSQALTAVHCVWDVTAAVAGLRNVRVEDLDLGPDDEAHRLLAESVAGFAEKYPDVPVTMRVTHGLVDDVLGGRTAAWDLVVIGRHPLDSVRRLITGSIASAVVERAQTTVAVVPEDLGRTEP